MLVLLTTCTEIIGCRTIPKRFRTSARRTQTDELLLLLILQLYLLSSFITAMAGVSCVTVGAILLLTDKT